MGRGSHESPRGCRGLRSAWRTPPYASQIGHGEQQPARAVPARSDGEARDEAGATWTAVRFDPDGAATEHTRRRFSGTRDVAVTSGPVERERRPSHCRGMDQRTSSTSRSCRCFQPAAGARYLYGGALRSRLIRRFTEMNPLEPDRGANAQNDPHPRRLAIKGDDDPYRDREEDRPAVDPTNERPLLNLRSALRRRRSEDPHAVLRE
jgi:hypothetical protein